MRRLVFVKLSSLPLRILSASALMIFISACSPDKKEEAQPNPVPPPQTYTESFQAPAPAAAASSQLPPPTGYFYSPTSAAPAEATATLPTGPEESMATYSPKKLADPSQITYVRRVEDMPQNLGTQLPDPKARQKTPDGADASKPDLVRKDSAGAPDLTPPINLNSEDAKKLDLVKRTNPPRRPATNPNSTPPLPTPSDLKIDATKPEKFNPNKKQKMIPMFEDDSDTTPSTPPAAPPDAPPAPTPNPDASKKTGAEVVPEAPAKTPPSPPPAPPVTLKKTETAVDTNAATEKPTLKIKPADQSHVTVIPNVTKTTPPATQPATQPAKKKKRRPATNPATVPDPLPPIVEQRKKIEDQPLDAPTRSTLLQDRINDLNDDSQWTDHFNEGLGFAGIPRELPKVDGDSAAPAAPPVVTPQPESPESTPHPTTSLATTLATNPASTPTKARDTPDAPGTADVKIGQPAAGTDLAMQVTLADGSLADTSTIEKVMHDLRTVVKVRPPTWKPNETTVLAIGAGALMVAEGIFIRKSGGKFGSVAGKSMIVGGGLLTAFGFASWFNFVDTNPENRWRTEFVKSDQALQLGQSLAASRDGKVLNIIKAKDRKEAIDRTNEFLNDLKGEMSDQGLIKKYISNPKDQEAALKLLEPVQTAVHENMRREARRILGQPFPEGTPAHPLPTTGPACP